MSPVGIRRDDICAVIVTYNPDERFCERLRVIQKQVGCVAIVDNGSSQICLPEEDLMTRQAIHVIRNGRNEGLAYALNQGCRFAVGRGYNWILTLDQDSDPELTLVDNLVAAWNACPFRERVGAVGSSYVTIKGALSSGYSKGAWREAVAVITSGMLFPAAVYQSVGPFREDFFIDYVDIEWSLRLRSRGYKIIVACQAVMFHRMGRPRVHRFLGKTVISTHHHALRRYYITRNRVTVWLRYFNAEPGYILRDMVSFLKEAAKIMLYEDAKVKKLVAILLGLGHALAGKLGELSGKAVRWLEHPT